MEIKLHVTVDGMHYRGSFGTTVPELLEEAWRPKDKCDDPVIRYCAGPGSASEDEMIIVMKMREDAAEVLAKQITALIVESMRQKDTTNGYPSQE